MKNFYHELPSNYKEFKVIDAKNKKVIIYMQLATLFLFLASFLIILLLKPIDITMIRDDIFSTLIFTMLGYFVYIVLHELVHGFWYKILTKQKLTFGLTLTVAFCGVPDIYVNKKTALLSITGPLILFSVILIPLLIILPPNSLYLSLLMLFSFHISGCSGDIYGTIVMLKHKGDLLMNDTGPKQTFYELEV